MGIPLLLMLAACTSLPFLESEQGRQDRELAARVRSALAADPQLEGSRIDVEVAQSKVTLLGSVPSWREGYRAVEVALRTTGVRGVSSRLSALQQ
ncbi:MAG TPA: BON domain-containing protein [Methylomirabilota bacterium]|nr:BON domain-containing protein [Methylomirabilota bacterium]